MGKKMTFKEKLSKVKRELIGKPAKTKKGEKKKKKDKPISSDSWLYFLVSIVGSLLLIAKVYQLEKVRSLRFLRSYDFENVLAEEIEIGKTLPREFPSDFPINERLKLLNVWRAETESMSGISAVWESDDEFENVNKYYKLKLLEKGWSTSLISDEAGFTRLMFEKDAKVGYLGISEDKGSVFISATIGQKKNKTD